MYLHFETPVHEDEGFDIPQLVEADLISPGIGSITGFKVGGVDISVDDKVIADFCAVVSRFNTEKLPPKHFRDCMHFAMAMCGMPMPTHQPFSRAYEMQLRCDDQIDIVATQGPTALGIPNDERCLGFKDRQFVYSHTVFGIESSVGTLCLSKLGVGPVYGLSTIDAALEEAGLEVAHPIQQLSVLLQETEIYCWQR